MKRDLMSLVSLFTIPQNVGLIEFQAFEDSKLNVAQMIISVFDIKG